MNKMEIKKYVLLDNNNILEISSPNNLNNDDLEYFKKHMRKTSDNIFELLRMGDFVEYYRRSMKFDRYFVDTIQPPILIDDNNVKYGNVIIGLDKEYNLKTSVYKKQSNGDYKKYEVEEWTITQY